jgi:hypothetical protein
MVIIKKEKSTSAKSFHMQTIERKKREISLPKDRYTFSKQRKLLNSYALLLNIS